jgi:chemotaxis protein CheX
MSPEDYAQGEIKKDAMDVNYINPFLEGTLDVIKTMASITAEAGKPYLKKSNVAAGDVSGIIGITGDATGSLAISFTEACICEIVNSMLGESHTSINTEIIDAVGELTNMISGSARNLMEKQGIKAFAAIPTVVYGKNHTITAIYNVPSIIIPFTTVSGPFFVDVCIKTTEKTERKAENYQVINKRTSNEPTPQADAVESRNESDNAVPADRGTTLRNKLHEFNALRSELDNLLTKNPFMEISRRKAMKNRIVDIDAKIRRLKLDISTWEMLSKMDADKLENPKIATNFQNYDNKKI